MVESLAGPTGITSRVLKTATGLEGVIVGTSTFPQTLPSPRPRRVCTTRLCTPAYATSRTDMAELDLDKILDTTDTIVQELLATGEFG